MSATLPASLGSGAYVSDYTVTSVDGHVVSGGIVFLVGHVKAGAITALARPRTSFTNWVDDFGQFLVYVGVLVGSGLAFFLAFILRGGDERRRLRRWTYAAAALGGRRHGGDGRRQSALTGGGFSSRDALEHRHAIVRRQVRGAVRRAAGRSRRLPGLAAPARAMSRQFAAFYGLLVAAGAFVLFGHALVSQERWLSIPADIVHVVFVAMWAGGLVGLVPVLRSRTRAARLAGQFRLGGRGGDSAGAPAPAGRSVTRATGPGTSTALLERPTGDAPAAGRRACGNAIGDGRTHCSADTAGVVGRFSTMAGISFAGILVAGTLLAIVEVGSVANLFETGYGQLLLLKIALVGLLLFVAGYNRYLLLPGLFSAAAARPAALARGWQRLVSTVRLEALGMVAVLGVTALLANGTPSNGASAPPPVPFTQTQPFDGGHVTLHITPNAAW